MKEIQLTQGQVALVDDEDFERVNAFKWQAHWMKKNNSFYAKRKNWPERKIINMSDFIMKTPDGMICDHINLNSLDNRKCNLRNCTKSQNEMNKGARSDNKLGVKCISLHQNKFRVEITTNKKKVFRKTFDTLEEAIVARDEALKIYHGEFANTK